MLALLAWLILQQPSCDTRIPQCAAYVAHLEWASTAHADSVWQSLRFVATPAEADRWFALSDATARRVFLTQFWQQRARSAGVYGYERYAEHLRRMDKAQRWFYASAGPRMIGAFATPAWYDSVKVVLVPRGRAAAAYPIPLDDRGIVFMRLGEPQQVERCSFRQRGEVWIYPSTPIDPEGRIIFFAPRGRDRGLQMVASVAQMQCDATEARGLTQRLSLYQPQQHLIQLYDWYSSRSYGAEQDIDIGVITKTLEDALQNPFATVFTEELARESRHVAAGAASAHAAIRSDRITRGYTSDLAVAFEFLYFAAPQSSRSDVTLTTAVPARQLRLGQSNDYRLRVFLTYLDAAGNIVARQDTTREFRLPRIPPRGAMLETHVRTVLPVGAYEYVLRMEGGDSAGPGGVQESGVTAPVLPGSGAVARGRIAVPAFDAAQLRLSSIALGRPSTMRSAWRRGSTSLALMPTHIVEADRQVALYYELSGASADRSYVTEITLQAGSDAERNRENYYAVRFDEDAAAIRSGTLASRRLIDLSDLQQGYYRLTIRVRENDANERSANMHTLVIVR